MMLLKENNRWYNLVKIINIKYNNQRFNNLKLMIIKKKIKNNKVSNDKILSKRFNKEDKNFLIVGLSNKMKKLFIKMIKVVTYVVNN